MKKFYLILLLAFTTNSYAQMSLLKRYQAADSLLQINKLTEACKLLKDIEPTCNKQDTLYLYILWSYVSVTSKLEMQYRLKERFDSSLYYGQEALKFIDKCKPYFDSSFAIRQYWMYKNMVISSFGLGKPDNARKYQDLLYKAYKDKQLPEGMDQYYNFSFFKWEGKNVWGYEWYPEPGDPETAGSFSKIVYYIYSTNADGTDKDHLYRLHVLNSPKMNASAKFDYVLTKCLEKASNEVSGTFYSYTYNRKIDYLKLRNDIKEVLKGNYYPGSTAAVIKKN
jgi:hypothetical protein